MNARDLWIWGTALMVMAIPSVLPGQTAVGTAFTYQGELIDDGVAVNGECDFEFTLWDAADEGTQIGPTLTPTVTVTDGRFTEPLDFGANVFTGEARWLKIQACCLSPCDPTTNPLGPRQRLTPTPNSVRASTAPWTGLTGVPAGFDDKLDDDTLGGLSCANGEVAKSNGGDWACAEDEVGCCWNQDGDDLFYTTGSVGIGTTGPFLTAGDSIEIMNATLPTPRSGLPCVGFPTTGKVYCFGGIDGSLTNEIIEYDPITRGLSTLSAHLPTPRFALACVASSAVNKIYCFGGDEGSTMQDEIVEFDPGIPDVPGPIPIMNAVLPSGRAGLACAASAATGKIYCFGGKDGSSARLDEIVEFDPGIPDVPGSIPIMNTVLPSPRFGLACATDSSTGKIYCFGGLTGANTYLDEIVEYDPGIPDLPGPIPIMDATLPSPRYAFTCATDSSTEVIYCFGGFNGPPETYFNEIVEYDPGIPDVPGSIPIMDAVLPSPRFGLACATDSSTGKIYCFGGANGGGFFGDIVEFTLPLQAVLQVGDAGDGTGAVANSWSVFSSRAFKRDISPLGRMDYQNILDKLITTDVVRYRYAEDAQQTIHLGVIAEESPPEILRPGGKAVSLGDFTAFLMAAIKSQQALIEEQDLLLADVLGRLEQVEAMLAAQTRVEEGGAK
ncbi:MAG: tail fiber domain-containing protein [Phycisphaerae bacterium]